MTDPTYPCQHCNRYTCRCQEVLEPSADGDGDGSNWAPWWAAMAANA